MNKKRVFGVVAFIVIGLFMFTFANPNQKVDDKKESKTKTEQKSKGENKKEENIVGENVVVEPVVNNIPQNNVVPAVQEVVNTVELENAKKAAIKELEEYKSDFKYADAIKHQDIVDEYTKAINEAKDITDVDRLKENGFDAIDALVKQDINTYIDAAIKNVENYKTGDEKYISEITDEKKSTINNLNGLKENEKVDYKNIKDEIDKMLDEVYNNIDTIIENKTFKVTFVGKNSIVETTAKYKKSVSAPTNIEFTNPKYKEVTYELTGFDKDFSEVKSNLTVTATYKITNIVANVYLNEGAMPNPKDSNAKKYSYLGSYELKIDNELLNASILANKNKTVYTNDNFDIKKLFKDDTQLPTLDGKYDYYEYYVVKFVAEGYYPSIHIDVIKMHDSKRELEDARNRLNDLIEGLPSDCVSEYTTNSCNALNKTVEDAKLLTQDSDIKDINEAISNIETAINNLVELEVTAVSVTLDKTEYIVDETPVATVKVTYNDEIRNQGDTTITNYEILTNIDTTSVSTLRTFKVKYANIESSVDYSVIYSNEQIVNKVAKISPAIDWHINWKYKKVPVIGKIPVGIDSIGFTIEFRNADQDVEATFIHKETDNVFTQKDRVIDLNKTGNKDKFDIDFTDYKRLWGTNTLFANDHVFVTYKVGNQYYTQRYMEKNNVLYRD